METAPTRTARANAQITSRTQLLKASQENTKIPTETCSLISTDTQLLQTQIEREALHADPVPYTESAQHTDHIVHVTSLLLLN